MKPHPSPIKSLRLLLLVWFLGILMAIPVFAEGGDTTQSSCSTDPTVCNADEYCRIKTDECLPLQHPEWGFQGFSVPDTNTYYLDASNCTSSTLQNIIDNVPADGGKIILPACTIETDQDIVLKSNIILEGAGMGQTIIRMTNYPAAPGTVIHGYGVHNIIIRNMTVDANSDSAGGGDTMGINFDYGCDNILVEQVESFDAYRQVFGFRNTSHFTARYNNATRGMHGVAAKIETGYDSSVGTSDGLIYSNQLSGNNAYGIDLARSTNIEVAGNDMHDNATAGAKFPHSRYIYLHHNDVNSNDGPGFVYYTYEGDSDYRYGILYVEYNDLSQNSGKAFTTWRDDSKQMEYLYVRNNETEGSIDWRNCNTVCNHCDIAEIGGYSGVLCDNNYDSDNQTPDSPTVWKFVFPLVPGTP